VDLSDAEPAVLIRFAGALAWFHGPPNDEAFAGHPLASRGLGRYGAYRVDQSSWLRRLERMNSVHPQHRPESYVGFNHYVFTFHDSTFECVARRFDTSTVTGPLSRVAHDMVRSLEAH